MANFLHFASRPYMLFYAQILVFVSYSAVTFFPDGTLILITTFGNFFGGFLIFSDLPCWPLRGTGGFIGNKFDHGISHQHVSQENRTTHIVLSQFSYENERL